MDYSIHHAAHPIVRLRDHAARLLMQAQRGFDAGNGSQTEQSLAAIRLEHQRLQRRVDQITSTLSP